MCYLREDGYQVTPANSLGYQTITRVIQYIPHEPLEHTTEVGEAHYSIQTDL